ncbi:type II secretion system protein GspM [Methylobacterium segetis]|uniref:type II secretion system protein GspM n=1 Tax=Methylobacterium segetis TaxID=2488750 RepID=UPI00104CDA78|nr:type II secretion system protein GspM [Methylobacterium segetis]
MRPGPALRFAVFLGCNALALLLVSGLILSPALGLLSDQQEAIARMEPRLEQARSAIARAAALSEQDPATLQDLAQRFVQGETESLLQADLLLRLREIAESHGVAFASVASLPEREAMGRRVVGARIEFQASDHRAAALLSSLERGPAFLFIRNAQLSAAGAQLSASGAEEPGEDAVSVSVEVYGVAGWSRS